VQLVVSVYSDGARTKSQTVENKDVHENFNFLFVSYANVKLNDEFACTMYITLSFLVRRALGKPIYISALLSFLLFFNALFV
jgi:hypothetical protein